MPTACPAKTWLKLIFLTQANSTAPGDHDGLIVERIVDVRQSGIGTRRRPIDFGRTLHVQGFVRTFVVEDLDELVEPSLLLQKIPSGRLGGLFLQREMHAFVAAVLLRVARLDPFDADAQPQPPDGQFAQVEQRVSRSEGYAVITANAGGHAALFKKPFKHSKSVAFSGRVRETPRE